MLGVVEPEWKNPRPMDTVVETMMPARSSNNGLSNRGDQFGENSLQLFAAVGSTTSLCLW